LYLDGRVDHLAGSGLPSTMLVMKWARFQIVSLRCVSFSPWLTSGWANAGIGVALIPVNPAIDIDRPPAAVQSARRQVGAYRFCPVILADILRLVPATIAAVALVAIELHERLSPKVNRLLGVLRLWRQQQTIREWHRPAWAMNCVCSVTSGESMLSSSPGCCPRLSSGDIPLHPAS
jgi:hypothetical protein